MNIVPGSQRLLVTYSGGIDSTYALWRLLRDGHNVVALHVNIRNLWGRDIPEELANHNVRSWLDGQGLRAEWMAGTVEYGNIVSPKYTRTVEIARFMAGMALRRPELKDVKIVVASGIKEDPKLPPEWVRSIHAVMEGAARRPVHLLRLIGHLAKTDVMDDMPPELLELAWYCNHPDGDKPCRACSTCKHVMRHHEQPTVKRKSHGLLAVNYHPERPT